jgi:hypothetical protein
VIAHVEIRTFRYDQNSRRYWRKHLEYLLGMFKGLRNGPTIVSTIETFMFDHLTIMTIKADAWHRVMIATLNMPADSEGFHIVMELTRVVMSSIQKPLEHYRNPTRSGDSSIREFLSQEGINLLSSIAVHYNC